MKRIQYLWLLLILSLIAVSCKKELTDQSMENLPDFYIDTVGLQTSFETNQSSGNVIIDPKVVYSGDENDLSYLWRVYGTTTGGDPTNTNIIPLDTIGYDKQLKSPIRFNPGDYIIELQVKDNVTGLTALMRYSVSVAASKPHGWLVAYEVAEGGSTDVALIRNTEIVPSLSKDTVMYNIYSEANGSPLIGAPLRVFSNVSLPRQDILLTDKEMSLLNRNDYQKVASFNQMFVGDPPPIMPEGIMEIPSFGNHMINDGDVYWMYSGLYIGKITVDDAKGYKAAPFGFRIYGKNGGFFDKLNRRFIYLEQQVSQGFNFGSPTNPSVRFDLSNIGKDLLHIGDGSDRTGDFTNQYAFFKDIDGSKIWFYGINFGTPLTPDLCKIDITSMTDIQNAKFFDLGILGSMALYATEEAVYNFVFDKNANVADPSTQGFVAPAGETITAIKLLKTSAAYVGGGTSISNKFLYVATWNATTKDGKVYVLPINSTSGTIDPNPAKVFTGFGKIKDMTIKQI